MAKDNEEVSAVQKFLGEVGTEGDKNAFQENSEDPFAKPEVATQEEEVKEEKPLPFNKDPKVMKFIEKELDRRLKDYVVTEEKPKPQGEEEFKDVMDSLTTAIGNDTPEKVSALNAFQKALTGLDKRASEKAIAHLEEIQQREVRADKEAEQELETAFENIEETFDVDITSNNASAKKTRQDFVAFIEKIAPKDRNGDILDYPDMQSAWETFTEIKKSNPTPNRAKDLASRGMARSAEASVGSPQSRTTWQQADDFISSLK